MKDFWAVLTKKAQNLVSHWASYTVLGSFILYVLGYLTLRFHLTVLGVGTDLSVLDERYLYSGTRFLIYLISLVPSLLILVLLLVAPIYLPYRILPSSIRVKVSDFFCRQWQSIRAWWLLSNRLALLGIFFALLMIQLVMRQCFLLSNLLLAEDLADIPVWLHHLLLTQNDGLMVLYFSGLIAGVLVSAAIFYALKNKSNDINDSKTLTSLLGFLVCVQLFLIPVNYGTLVIDKSMPRVAELNKQGTIKPDQQAWLVWEGNEGKTFLLRKQQVGIYQKSLMTLPKKEIKKVEISGYDRIFNVLFSRTSTKPAR